MKVTPVIGIFTYHFSDNFGAVLQAYGLQRWLKSNGCDAGFVNYHPVHVEEGGGFRELFRAKGLKAKAKIIFLRLSFYKRRLFGNRKQIALFAEFQKNVLGVDKERLYSAKDVEGELYFGGKKFDMLICGSDQIWSPSVQYGFDPVYFLSFSKGLTLPRRVSYAPSFGRSRFEIDDKRLLALHLSGLDAISVREKNAIEIVEDVVGVKPACVPDPVILCGDFSDFTESVDVNGHIFCYALRTGDGIRDIANKVAQDSMKEILSPYNAHRRWKEIGKTIHPSPAEWVSYLANSSAVVTNSFHGTVFSLIFHRPFLTVMLPGKRDELNERSRNLLQEVGLLDRLVDGSNVDSAMKVLKKPIDWGSVDAALEKMRRNGEEFLHEQLELAAHE